MGDCKVMDDKRPDCEKEFLRIWERLSTGDSRFELLTGKNSEQDIELNTLKINMQHLVNSITGLTKAIWGMISSILMILAGFLLWYIQNK